jgi:polar amino acid transport system substrate-binding protein
MKKIFIVALATLLFVSSAFSSPVSESADNSLEYVVKKGVFVLGLDDSFPPMGFRDENNEIVGFDIDCAKEVCKRLGVELKCQPIDWNAKEQELATKQIDCIWNGFTITPERQEALTFSEAYVGNAQVIIVKSDSSIKTLSDLAGKAVGVQAGSSGQVALESSGDLYKSIKGEVEFKDFLTALMDLEIGGVDAVVIDLFVANFNIKDSGKSFRILEESLEAEEYGIGFRKGDEKLCTAVEDALKAMAKDGTLAQISTRWFGADITTVGK